MDDAALIRALEATLVANDQVMDSIMHNAEKMGISPYRLMNRDGTYAMVPVLHTRAMILSSLASLRSS